MFQASGCLTENVVIASCYVSVRETAATAIGAEFHDYLINDRKGMEFRSVPQGPAGLLAILVWHGPRGLALWNVIGAAPPDTRILQDHMLGVPIGYSSHTFRSCLAACSCRDQEIHGS